MAPSHELDKATMIYTYPERIVADHAQCQLSAALHCVAGKGRLLLGLVVSFRLGEQAQVALVVAVNIRHTDRPRRSVRRNPASVKKKGTLYIPAHVQAYGLEPRG
jgi:hypothetical protein